MRRDIDRQVAQLAERQHGVFGRSQLRRLGASKDLVRRRVAAGRWERVALGVFRLRGSRKTWLQTLMIRCLSWGEGTVVSHRTAAALFVLPGFGRGPVQVTAPPGRRRRAAGGRGLVVRRTLAPADVTTIEGIPATRPARTLIDLASVVSRDELEVALDDALRRGLVSIPKLRWRLAESPRRPGNAVVRSLLAAREGIAVPGSPFETMLLRAIADAGLPMPITQHPIRVEGRTVAIVDFAFLAEGVAVEADGYEHHTGRARWDHDRARRNQLTVDGWLVIHVTWTEFKRRPQAVIETIRRALASRAPESPDRSATSARKPRRN